MTNEELREELGRLKNDLEKAFEGLEGLERRIEDWLEDLNEEEDESEHPLSKEQRERWEAEG